MRLPDLQFQFPTMPPRRTWQGGLRHVADPAAEGGVRVYTDQAHRLEAWQLMGEFARRLPEGWVPPEKGWCKVCVELVYKARKSDRLKGDEIVPHTERPDADNLVKSILDSMQRARVIAEDAMVSDLRVRKWRGLRPRWAVFVWFEKKGENGK